MKIETETYFESDTTMTLRCYRWTLMIAFSTLLVGCTYSADTADLKIKFIYDGESLPAKVPIDTSKDPWCGSAGDPLYEEKLIVDPKTRGIQNVVILPDRRSNLDVSDVPAELMKKAKEPGVIKVENCRYSPRLISTVAGGTVTVDYLDDTGHNANFSFFNNPASGSIIPAYEKSRQVKIEKAEYAPIPIECNVHPWMKAYVIVSETPYVGISGQDGVLLIEKLPVGKQIKLKVWHEATAGPIEKVQLDGKIVDWKKGVVELTLKPGMNDLGECRLTRELFKR